MNGTQAFQNIEIWVAKSWDHTPRPSSKDQIKCIATGRPWHQASVRVQRYIVKCAWGQTPCYDEARRALAIATNRVSEHRDLFQLSRNISGDFLLDVPEGNQASRAKETFLAELDSLIGRRKLKTEGTP